jgi:histidinol-phosphate aminotransferase
VSAPIAATPRSRLATADAYARPAPRRDGLLRLDGNEGARPPASLVGLLAQDASETLRLYPDVSALEAQLARRFGIEPCRVVVTAGADDAIDRACRAFLGAQREIVLPSPTFEMIERYARLADGALVSVPWDDAWPRAAVLAAISERTGIVAMVSPNNPSGGVVTRDDLEAVARAAPDALVLLDHAYVEYADDDLTRAALGLSNVLVTRTFSKAWGLAGCRVGYALGSAPVATLLRRAGAPYAVASPSLLLAQARLATGEDDVATHVAIVREERSRIAEALRARGAGVRASQANFVLADLGERAAFVHEALQALGVLVRAFRGRPELETRLRITLPGEAEGFRRLHVALETVLAPEALLLDLDGVLADTERSYRACVLATCASFGAPISRLQLHEAVMAGDANNDWELTRRLLAARNIDVTLTEITERYQRLYLGADGAQGLRESECLIVAADLVARLARRLPLGIVTGRPRDEAEWFLRRAGIREHVSALSCFEDGPLKPDPAPVRLALAQLGVARAWMVGDTPDDARAAAGAGVLPLGVVAPGDDATSSSEALLSAGCARVLDSLSDLERLLP